MNIYLNSREDVYKILSEIPFHRLGIHEKHFENNPEVLEQMINNRELKRNARPKSWTYILTEHGESVLEDYRKSGKLREIAAPNFEGERTSIEMYKLFVPHIGVHEDDFLKINPVVLDDMVKNKEIELQPHTSGENIYRLTEVGKKKLDQFLEYEEIEWRN